MPQSLHIFQLWGIKVSKKEVWVIKARRGVNFGVSNFEKKFGVVKLKEVQTLGMKWWGKTLCCQSGGETFGYLKFKMV